MLRIEEQPLYQQYSKIIARTSRSLSIGPGNDPDNLIKTEHWAEFSASASFFYLDWKKKGGRYFLTTERLRAQPRDDIEHLADSAAQALMSRSANCLGMCCVWVYLFLQTSFFKNNQGHFIFTFLELKDPYDHVWLKIKFKKEILYVDPHQKIIYNQGDLKNYLQVYKSKFADLEEESTAILSAPKIQQYAELCSKDIKKFMHAVERIKHLEIDELYTKTASNRSL